MTKARDGQQNAARDHDGADPAAVFAAARAGDRVVGWKLDAEQRRRLLELYPPRYENVVADHVTLKPKVAADTPLPGEQMAQIVGHADDGCGVEAMVVAIGSSTGRPDGGTYHVTWSLAVGRRARESNDVIAAAPWKRLPQPVALTLTPALFPRLGGGPHPLT